jgi:hypothetical protein
MADALGERDLRALDETVRVQDHDLAGRQRQLALVKTLVGECIKRRGGSNLDHAGRSTTDHNRRKVSRACHSHRAGLAIEHRIGRGRHSGFRHRSHEPIHELQGRRRIAILEAECPRRQRAHVQHADQITLHHQRQPEQRADALLPQDRVQDVGVVDVGDEDRHAFGGDPAREPLADRDPNPLLHLLLDALRSPRDPLLGGASNVIPEDRDCDAR